MNLLKQLLEPKIQLSELDLILPEINGISDVTENTLSLSASGPVENFRISNQKNFIGKLQMVTFKLQ